MAAVSGIALISIYGWPTSSFVEFYTQEYSNRAGGEQGTKLDTIVRDNSTYDI